eukprot:7813522-Pyramimonas_sp.AAC.2
MLAASDWSITRISPPDRYVRAEACVALALLASDWSESTPGRHLGAGLAVADQSGRPRLRVRGSSTNQDA